VEASDRDRVVAFLDERGMRYAARLGELHHAGGDEALIAEDAEDELIGVLTYVIDGSGCEISSLYAASRLGGIGTALIGAVMDVARGVGCRRLWLVTTNDNVDALRFYQRRGFRLAELHAGAVDRSRATIKPSIPENGDHGIPIRDELVLERVLASGRATTSAEPTSGPPADGTSGVPSHR
jgi:GNAT superfamily N-acetyltransferase